MYSLKTLLHLALLPLVANAYILRAYTDSECTEGEKDMSADDPSSNGPCMDIGFTAKSIYWVDDYPLDGWRDFRNGCPNGTGGEDAQFSGGNPDNDEACNNLEQSDQATDGVRYLMYSHDAF